MALPVGLLLLWVCGFHCVVCPDYEDDDPPAVETIIHFPEVKDGKCFFPFHYKNGIFYDCVKLKTKHKWCSVNETYQGYWKYCSEDDFAKCVFPFWYRHMIYRECTEDGDAFGRKWCSLTQHYNKDKIWKYCD
ncbi:binder of sperm protein homolog 1-like [Enhydra lutris kenyoni]|uniref:Binder of sperm protein homolog 1-like n=1 Tax=Enhydra lutris kenyoni TaxID=391180 RepID=A0A2Y9LD49_ENHLU|nr:binder of sperm protein homolog 1-like [Enhydra lutris kenyoni]